jgi:hypothetical protein
LVPHAAAVAEAGGAEPAVAEFLRLETLGAVDQVGQQLGWVKARLQRLALVVLAGKSAEQRYPVRRQGVEAIHCGTPPEALAWQTLPWPC